MLSIQKIGQLSQSIFYVLWNKIANEPSKNGVVPEDIKDYFQIILREGAKINPSVLFHFGSNLYALWRLDKKWTMENIKPFNGLET